MNHERCLQIFLKHAAGVVIAEPQGKVLNHTTHGKLSMAPVKLIALAEQNSDGSNRIVGEIGLGRGHPYLSNHQVKPHLPQRQPTERATLQYLASITPQLIAMLQLFLSERASRWQKYAYSRYQPQERSSKKRKTTEPVIQRGRRVGRLYTIPRGISAHVDHNDLTLLRFFEELEWLNPVLQKRIRGIAGHLDALTGGYRQVILNTSPYPRGVEQALDLLARTDSQILLRSHILGAIGRRMRRPDLLFDALRGSKIIGEECYEKVTELTARRGEPLFPFRILPKEAAYWNVLNGKGLWVILRYKLNRHSRFEIAQTQPTAQQILAFQGTSQRSGPVDLNQEPDWIRE